jgi:hypothetical protein
MKYLMKKTLIITLTCLALLFLFACSNDEQGVAEVTLSTAHMDNYAYITERISLGDIGDARVQAVTIHNERVYLCYDGQSPAGRYALVVLSVSADGLDVQHTEIHPDDLTIVTGMQITADSTIALLAIQGLFSQDGSTVFYAEYDFDGNELLRKDFGDLLPQLRGQHAVRQAVFTNDGDIALSLEHEHGNAVYLLSTKNDSVTALQLNSSILRNNHIVRLADDRVLVFDTETDEVFSQNVFLREVDFENNRWGYTYPIIGSHSSNLSPVLESAPFDLLISDNNNLYGYSLETGVQMTLLSWGATELLNTAEAFAGMFSDERLFAVTGGWGASAEMFYLTPTLRSEQQTTTETIVLTLGGLRIPDDIRSAVIDFNRDNQNYRIEVVDYLGPDHDWYGGLARLQVELMTGRGPDLLYDWSRELRAPGYLLDLYPFIDADPELSREDFIPNILRAMEHSDGSLYRIANSYAVITMVGVAENLGHIDSWTLTRMQELIEGALHLPHALGNLMVGQFFIIVMLDNTDFIDWDNYRANLDNEAVISILEIAKILPSEQKVEDAYTSPLVYLLRGEQLLEETQFGNLREFLGYAEVLGESFTILGKPSTEGGVNTVHPRNPIGISAASAHADAAWEFLRRFLLPVKLPDNDVHSVLNYTFPIRIDTFEALIEAAQTPLLFPDADGNPVEYPRGEFTFVEWVDDRYFITTVDIYAMTDDVVKKLRDFIESAQPPARRLDPGLIDLILGDFMAFFDGIRSAEDTARIMQSRVQIYLSEQELLG